MGWAHALQWVSGVTGFVECYAAARLAELLALVPVDSSTPLPLPSPSPPPSPSPQTSDDEEEVEVDQELTYVDLALLPVGLLEASLGPVPLQTALREINGPHGAWWVGSWRVTAGEAAAATTALLPLPPPPPPAVSAPRLP